MQGLGAEGSRNADCSAVKHLLSSTHRACIGKDIIISLYKIFSFNLPPDPRIRKKGDGKDLEKPIPV